MSVIRPNIYVLSSVNLFDPIVMAANICALKSDNVHHTQYISPREEYCILKAPCNLEHFV